MLGAAVEGTALFHVALGQLPALGHALGQLLALRGREHRGRVHQRLHPALAAGVVLGHHLLAQGFDRAGVDHRRDHQRGHLLAQRAPLPALRRHVVAGSLHDGLDLRLLFGAGAHRVQLSAHHVRAGAIAMHRMAGARALGKHLAGGGQQGQCQHRGGEQAGGESGQARSGGHGIPFRVAGPGGTVDGRTAWMLRPGIEPGMQRR